MSSVRAIGLSGQMHAAVLLDAAGEVLRPAILWNDGRSGPQCAELERRAPALHRIAGNLAMPGFTAPKLLWVREYEPQVFERTACVLLPKDWLRWRLTGERITDKQRKRLWVIIRNSGRTEQSVKDWLHTRFGWTSTKDIPRNTYDFICKAIESPADLPEGK